MENLSHYIKSQLVAIGFDMKRQYVKHTNHYFLGTFKNYDLYTLARQEDIKVVARFGNNSGNYHSNYHVPIPVSREAYKRAQIAKIIQQRFAPDVLREKLLIFNFRWDKHFA